ncbi:hypothetical protein SEA_ARTI_3 [Gordonia phage Arti]|nr:hypothetical protein SEA_ARTI_3 [Gordonia phage Arti]
MIKGHTPEERKQVSDALRDILQKIPTEYVASLSETDLNVIIASIASDNRIVLISNEDSDTVAKKAFEGLVDVDEHRDRVQRMWADGDDNFFAARQDQVKAANTLTNALVRAGAEFGPMDTQIAWRKIAQAIVTHARLIVLTVDMLSDEEISAIYTAMSNKDLRVDVRPWDVVPREELRAEHGRALAARDRATEALEKAEKQRQEAIDTLARERRTWAAAKERDQLLIADLNEQIRAYQQYPKPNPFVRYVDDDPFERLLKKVDEVREGVDKILAGGEMPKRFVAGEIPDGPVGTFIDGRVHLAVNPDGTTGEVTFGTPTISDEAAIAEPQERDRAEDNLIRKVRDVVAAEFERELYDRHTGSAGTTGFDFGTLIAETLFANDLISVYDEVDQEAVEELVDGETEIVETAIDDRIDVNRGDRWQNEISMALDGLTPESAGNTAYRLRTSAQAAEEVRKLRTKAKLDQDWRQQISGALGVRPGEVNFDLDAAVAKVKELKLDGWRWRNDVSATLNSHSQLELPEALDRIKKLRNVDRAKARGDEWRHAIGKALGMGEPSALGLAEAVTAILAQQRERFTVDTDRVEIVSEPGKVRSLVEDAVLGVLKDDYLREHGHPAGETSERAARMAVMANQAWFRLAENLLDD